MNPSSQKISREISWTLSPFYVLWGGFADHVPLEVSALVWNVILLAVAGLVHCALLFAAKTYGMSLDGAATYVMFPYLTLNLGVLLFQGTTFSAYRILFSMEWSYAPVALAVLAGSYGLTVYMWWIKNKMTAHWWAVLPGFAPAGYWLPTEEVSRHGIMFSEFNEANVQFKLVVIGFIHVMPLLTAFWPRSSGGCQAQLILCAVATFLFAITYGGK